jgi:hypothetical protein
MMLSYTPLQIQTAYGFNDIMYGSVKGNGAGQTIAILDPGSDLNFVNSTDPNFSKSDLAVFDADYGLPNPPSFKVIGENGGARPTYANPADNDVDYGETAGDVEWVHALAPGANIVLIELTNSTASDRSRALTIAVPACGATVVSMSFGGLESSDDTNTATSATVGITSESESGNTVTITTPTRLGVTDDSVVTIAGAGGYNGVFTVTSVSSNGLTFKYTDPTMMLGSSTGGTATLPLFDDGDFTEPGVTYVASSGDRGAPGVFPANSPNVIAVGATNLEADSSGNYVAETAWSNPSNINSATEIGDVVTITTQNSTGALVGNNVTVANVGLTGYDGDFVVTATSGSTTFSYIDTHASGLSNSSGGTAVAGAFSAAAQATELNPPVQIIDDSSSSGFSTTGAWTQSNTGGYDGEYLTAVGGSSATATWTFDVPVGVKEGISLTWVAGAGDATNATYTIKDGTDTYTETVDQKNPPNDNTGASYAPSSTPFQEVIQEVISTTGVITVSLDASTANGTVSADAVAVAYDNNPGGTGGGFSQYEPQPAYQAGVVIHNGNTVISSNGMRTTPDVSMIGGAGEPVDIVNSGATLFAGTKGTFAGTSLAAPCWAALIADADQGRALSGLGSLTGSSQTLPMLYALPSYVFHDITIGFNGYNAGPGYDLISGLGSPKANLVAAGLGGVVASGGFSISAYKGTTFSSQTVATFENPGGYTAHTTINWGDGSPDTSGTIVGPGANGLYQLEGTHDYAQQGIYTITVTISFGPGVGATVTSTAIVSYNVGILLLDPTGSGALTTSGNGGVSVTGGGDLIIDSSSSKAGVQSGNGTVSAAVIDVTGKVTHSGSGGFVGPVQSEPSYADPLATLAAPTPAGPTFNNTVISGSKTVTMSPGTYVGGIQISGSSKVTLLPGIYILQGGGLTVSGASSLTGAGVVIYNASSTGGAGIDFSGSSSITLSAMTSGAYQGIVFFQNRSLTAQVVLGSGDVTVNLTGVVYAPGAPIIAGGSGSVSIKGNAGSGISGALIADDLSLSGDEQFSVDASANSVSGSLPPLSV